MKLMKRWISRRQFVIGGGAGTLLWSCGGRTGSNIVKPDELCTQPPSRLPTCGELTLPNIEGPFFLPGSTQRTIIGDSEGGLELILQGRVVTDDCVPVAGAMLDFWQADARGDYHPIAFRGHQFTDDEGRYTLETVIPGRYLNGDRFRPSHIHVKVGARELGLLTTQLYFPCDPYVQGDPFFEPDLLLAYDATAKTAAFEFVLGRPDQD